MIIRRYLYGQTYVAMKYFFLLVLVGGLFGCGRQTEIAYQFKDKQAVMVHELRYPGLMGITLQLIKIDSLLLVSDFQGDTLVSLYNPESRKIEKRLIAKGHGPGELVSPLEIQYTGSKLWVTSRSLFRLNVMPDNWKTEPFPKPQKVMQLPPQSNNLVALSDNLFVLSSLGEKRYILMDLRKQDDMKPFGEYPDFWDKEKDFPSDAKAMFHQPHFAKHPSRPLFASCSNYVLEIYRYDESGNKLPELVMRKQLGKYSYKYTSGQMLSTKTEAGSDPKATELACSEKYLYIVTQSPENRKLSNVMVIDWEGNPVRCLQTDEYIICLAIDEDNNKAYCVYENQEDQMGYFKLR